MIFAANSRQMISKARFGAPTEMPLSLVHPEQYIKSVNHLYRRPQNTQHVTFVSSMSVFSTILKRLKPTLRDIVMAKKRLTLKQ